jgi:hypothetical protein
MRIGPLDFQCNLAREHLFRQFYSRITVMTSNEVPRSGVFQSAEEADMKDAKTYREYAADCIRMAKLVSPKDKAALLKMAEAWEERAQDAERQENKPEGR